METTPQPFQVLYVSDIDHVSREEHLWQAFAPWAHGIRSIRLIRDITKPFALTHAYVNFTNHKDAKEALTNIQPLFINSSYCRVVPYDGVALMRPTRFDQNGGSGVFVKNLDMQVTAAMLWGFFMGFGQIIGCRIAIDEFSVPRGFAYITYESPEQASAAIKAMDGQLIGRRRIFASRNLPKGQRGTRIFIKFEGDITTREIRDIEISDKLQTFGSLESVSVPRDQFGHLRGFAFATFRDHNEAMRALNEVKEIAGIPVYVDLATGTGQRYPSPNSEAINNSSQLASSNGPRKHPSEGDPASNKAAASAAATPSNNGGTASESTSNNASYNASSTASPVAGGLANKQSINNTNLFVRPLSSDVGESDLQDEFGKFGTITSAKVMIDQDGNSRGFGFVSYDNIESAAKAVEELNGAEKWGQELFVAPAQSRRKPHPRLNLHHSHPHPHGSRGIPSPMAAPFPGLYYIPMEYAYEYSPYAANAAFSAAMTPPGTVVPGPPLPMAMGTTSRPHLEKVSVEELGEMLHPHVVQHSAIGGDLDLASRITGLLLQQPQKDIVSWLESPVLMDLRIQQGYDAFQDWAQQTQKGQV